jgi:hypothetical protein
MKELPLAFPERALSEEIPESWQSHEKVLSAQSRTAQNSRHPPVDGVHSIDFPADRTPPFLLTLKIEGVKTNSFFDTF